IYYVDNAGDTVTEQVGEGTDQVVSTIAYTLGANVENLTLAGAGTVTGLNGTGNELDNTIFGTNGDNILSGLGGNDALYAKGGNDTLSGGDGNDRLDGGVGADSMTGGLGNDTLDGGNGNDHIYGGNGQDTMTGGAGNDIFYFTNISESLVGSADLITDFTSTSGAGASDDKLDISGIDADTNTAGDQAFGWAGLTATAHSIWIGGFNSDGSVTLYGD